MDLILHIQNCLLKKGTPWIELDEIRNRNWFISVDIEDQEIVPVHDTEDERYSTGVDYRLEEDVSFKSVKILNEKTQETLPYWKTLLDMSSQYSYELREVTFKNLPKENGVYVIKMWYDQDGINFGNNFKRILNYES